MTADPKHIAALNEKPVTERLSARWVSGYHPGGVRIDLYRRDGAHLATMMLDTVEAYDLARSLGEAADRSEPE